MRIVESLQTDNITVDWYRQLYKNKGNSIRYLYSNSIRDQAFASYQNFIRTGYLAPTQEACEQFTKDLKCHIRELKNISCEFGIYLNDFPCIQPGMAGTEHCVLNSEMFFRKQINDVSTMEWLWDAIQGRVSDIGMALLQ